MWPFSIQQKGNPETEEKVLVIDVGSSRIASAIVLLASGRKPIIFSMSKHAIQTGDYFDIERYKKVIQKSIKESVNSLRHDHRTKSYSRVIVTISPLIHKINLRTISVSGLDKKKITESYISRLIENNIGSITGNRTNPVVIMDKEIMSVSLNGYETSNFLENNANSVIIKLFLSIVNSDIADIIIESIKDCTHLHRDNISLHSFEYAAWNVIQSIFDQKNYTYVEFGDETTDLMDIHRGVISTQTSLPAGRQILIREYAKLTRKPYVIAESELRMHYTLKLKTHAEAKDFSKLELEQASLWKNADKSHKNSGENHPIIVLIGDNSFNNFIHNVLERLGFSHKNAKVLNKDMLSRYCNVSSSNIDDLFIMLSIIFSAKIKG
ncbi:MAG: hypothetical protein HZA95_01925 [Candidatus Vogelbacteria bacterium]|nr:hypothetical protein [Candidatus Vogelbacteria bacterium]